MVRVLGLVPVEAKVGEPHGGVDEAQVRCVPHVRVPEVAGNTVAPVPLEVIARAQLRRHAGKGAVDEAAAAGPVRRQLRPGEQHRRRWCQLVRRHVLAVAAKAPYGVKDRRAEELILAGRVERPVPVRQTVLIPARLNLLLKVKQEPSVPRVEGPLQTVKFDPSDKFRREGSYHEMRIPDVGDVCSHKVFISVVRCWDDGVLL